MPRLVSPLMVRLHAPPIAVRNVLTAWRRSAVAIFGMGFAVVMVLLQLGFLQAVRITAAVNYDQLDFDLVLVSPDFEQFYDPGSFPRARLRQAEGLPTVVSARPLQARMQLWRCPPYPPDGPVDGPPTARELGALQRWWLGAKRPRAAQRRALLVLGIEPDAHPFRAPIRDQIAAAGAALRMDGRWLMNAWSNPDFGWDLRDRFHGWELGAGRAEIVGPFTLRRSFGADAAVLGTEANFARTFGLTSPGGPVNFGLVTVAPGTAAATARALNGRLPPDVKALSRAALYRIEEDYWVNQTATGKIFSFGVAVTMFVAAVVVYQVLSNDVRDHLPEYATLKAMGYTHSLLSSIVLAQAAIYAVAAFLPAALVSHGLYRVTETLANIPMDLTPLNLARVLALTLATSFVSGLLTLRKVRSADPAALFA
jgi:putative ABC transport system permease protein